MMRGDTTPCGLLFGGPTTGKHRRPGACCTRGLSGGGPPVRAPQILAARHGGGGPGARVFLLTGTWFLLRVEAAHVSLQDVTILGEGFRGGCAVGPRLPVSKTDQREAGVGRTHGCLCGTASGSEGPTLECPACAVVEQVAHIRTGWPEAGGEFQLFLSFDGARVSKAMAARAIRPVALSLGLGRGPPDVEVRFSGHSLRVGGAEPSQVRGRHCHDRVVGPPRRVHDHSVRLRRAACEFQRRGRCHRVSPDWRLTGRRLGGDRRPPSASQNGALKTWSLLGGCTRP